MGNRSNTSPSYPRFSMDDLRKLIVPNFQTLGKAAVNRLAQAYDQHANSVMLPLPQMNQCPVRQGLDEAVCEALGVAEEMVATIRRQLAMEPSITGKRYTGPGG